MAWFPMLRAPLPGSPPPPVLLRPAKGSITRHPLPVAGNRPYSRGQQPVGRGRRER
jgi:hypothetical protein